MDGVSVVICCYNASNRIVPTLQHLQKQNFTTQLNWEVIVVDNASTDNTSEIAKEIWSKEPVTDLLIIMEDKPGLMNARRKGLESASYEIVSFIDDDNWVETDWVQKVANVFARSEKIGVCGGKSEAIFENLSPAWFPLFENSFAVGKQAGESGVIDNKKGFLWGAGLSIRKSLWFDLQRKGFRNITMGREGKNITAGEDTELCYAFRLMGYHLYYDDDLVMKHYMPDGRMNVSYLKKMHKGFGKANVRLNLYRVLLYPNSFELHSWWYEWLVALKKIVRESLVVYFPGNEKKKWRAQTQIAYWKGYASQTWEDKNERNSMINAIRSVYNIKISPSRKPK